MDGLDLPSPTPLVELAHLSPRSGVRLFAKLEGRNPTGSVKDRVAAALVDAAERRGAIEPGALLVEASSGNTAIALAHIARRRGYRLKVVLPDGIVPAICDVLGLLGVDVVRCAPRAGMRGAIELAEAIAGEEGGYAVRQFCDPENVAVHYRTTGAEIVGALPRVDAFVAGIGTGGTVTGAGRRIKEAHPGARVIGVQPAMGEHLQGLRDISEGYELPLLDLDLLDGRFQVDAATAIRATEEVARVEGIIAGVSAGATLHVARRVAERLGEGVIVCMFSDSGWKYIPARPWDDARAGCGGLDDRHWW